MRNEADEIFCEGIGLPVDASQGQVFQRFETIAPRLAHLDVASYQVYCMLKSLSPAICGCFDPLSYFAIRKQLPEDRGPGVVLFVSEGFLQRIPSHCLVEVLFWILLHEFGHAICALASGGFEKLIATFADVADLPEVVTAVANRLAPMTDPLRTEAGPQWESHGLDFTRAMAHLDYRLRCMGVQSEIAAAGHRYGQRPYVDCVAALGDEPAQCVDKSFSEILSRDVPPAFAACLATDAPGALVQAL